MGYRVFPPGTAGALPALSLKFWLEAHWDIGFSHQELLVHDLLSHLKFWVEADRISGFPTGSSGCRPTPEPPYPRVAPRWIDIPRLKSGCRE